MALGCYRWRNMGSPPPGDTHDIWYDQTHMKFARINTSPPKPTNRKYNFFNLQPNTFVYWKRNSLNLLKFIWPARFIKKAACTFSWIKRAIPHVMYNMVFSGQASRLARGTYNVNYTYIKAQLVIAHTKPAWFAVKKGDPVERKHLGRLSYLELIF